MTDTDIMQSIAKNVRIQMQKRDVTSVHVAHKLKLADDKVKGRLNGKIPFSDEELEILAPYLDTTYEAFHVLVVAAPDNKPTATVAPEAKAGVKTVFEPAAIALISITDKREDLSELMKKMFMARLSGKIEDLPYYLRNNVLLKALKDYGGPVSEEEKLVFVNHYMAKFEQWKKGLVSDIEDITEVALTSDQLEGVQSVILPSEKNRLRQFLGMLAKDCTGDDKVTVDIQQLAAEVDKAAAHLKTVRRLLVDYLVSKEK